MKPQTLVPMPTAAIAPARDFSADDLDDMNDALARASAALRLLAEMEQPLAPQLRSEWIATAARYETLRLRIRQIALERNI